jgi:hypothetical protein
MTRIAVSGHRGLTPKIEEFVAHTIREELSQFVAGDLVGLSCLADGADQIFARAVIDLGGTLEVFIPAARYLDSLPEPAHPEYDDLLSRAIAVHRLDHQESTSESHMDASVQMLRGADLLFAIWDGLPARSFGGTADVVAHARDIDVPVTVIWPEGATRN